MCCDNTIYVRKGDTADAQLFRFEYDNGEYRSLIGCECFFEIRRYDNRVMLFKLGKGLSLRGPYTLVLDKIKRVDLQPGNYSFAVKIQEPDGDLYTYIEGKYIVKPEKVNEDEL